MAERRLSYETKRVRRPTTRGKKNGGVRAEYAYTVVCIYAL